MNYRDLVSNQSNNILHLINSLPYRLYQSPQLVRRSNRVTIRADSPIHIFLDFFRARGAALEFLIFCVGDLDVFLVV